MSTHRHSVNGSFSSKGKSSLIERHVEADQALSIRYDALNQALNEAEQRLKALKPLHPVWVAYEHQQFEGEPGFWELLGISKHQGKWRLCHGCDNDLNDYGPLQVQPIVECNVDVRVRAARVVRQLHEEIVKSKEAYIPFVDEAINELKEACEDI
jgi:hypothetical protein